MKKIKIYTAPMAGVSDYTFRENLEIFNPDLIFTEMINVSMIDFTKKDIPKILKFRNNNAIQLFGNDNEKMKLATRYVENIGYNHINLNCGCPMKKITSNGNGSALIKDPEKIKEILLSILEVKNSKTKISLKIRVGYDKPENYLKIAKIASDLKLDHITIHGRTKKQSYDGVANWDYIKEVKENIDIPVIGNGDLFEVNDIVEKIKYSKVDGIMLARGILGNPWLINDIRNTLENKKCKKVSDEERIKFLIEYIRKYEINNEYNFYKDIRKYINWYIEKIENINLTSIREKLNSFENYGAIINLLEKLI